MEETIAAADTELVSNAADAAVPTDAGLDGEGVEVSDLEILNQEDSETKPAVEAEVKPAAEQKPAEAKADDKNAEAKPAEVKADDKKAEAPKVEKEQPASVKALNEQIKKNPALEKELAKPENAPLRNMLYANARRAEELGEFRRRFANLEVADHAKEIAEEFTDLNNDYFSDKPEGFDSLLERLFMAQVERDKDGKPKIADAVTGRYATKGVFEKFFTHHRANYFWPQLHRLAKQNNREDVVEAAELIQEILGEAPRGSKPKAKAEGEEDKSSEYPAEVQQKLADYDSLKREQGKAAELAAQQYETSVKSVVETDVKSMLRERVERLAASLSDPIKKRIIDDAYLEVGKTAAADKLFQSDWNRTFRSAETSDETKKLLSGKSVGYAKGIAGPILQKLVKEFSVEAIAANTEKHEKLKTQQAKAEPKSAGGPTPPRQGDEHSMIREAEKLSQKYRKRSLTDLEIMEVEETLPLLQKLAAAR